jgi:hypothetical protein
MGSITTTREKSGPPFPPSPPGVKTFNFSSPTDFTHDKKSDNPEPELNSYKFKRPTIYVPNIYQSKQTDTTDILTDITSNVGPKNKTSIVCSVLG